MRMMVLPALVGTSLAAGLSLLGVPSHAEVVAADPISPGIAQILREDPTASLDSRGRHFYSEPVPDGARAAARARPLAPTAAPVFPLADTFSLHSLPGSNRTIYLDFDGEYVSGTAWNEEGLPAAQYPAWTLDGNASTFNSAERTIIQEVWQQVAEDFAPFDVDVTTADPGDAGIVRSSSGDQVFGTRALITPSNSAVANTCGECVGVAYVDVFDEVGGSAQPVWVFPQFYNETKGIAETISHEVGHNLALRHDGDSQEAYHAGHNSWAPIMGQSDYEPITQWSRGDYPDADNQQDDVAVIASHGLEMRADEAGNTFSAAAAAPPSGLAYITTRTDKDFFELGDCTGAVVITAEGSSISPNLDIELRLYDAGGTEVKKADPTSAKVSATVATGMSATLTATVTPGAYVVGVDGVGRGTWSNGYDDYGSLGQYDLDVTGCNGVPTDPDPEPDPDPVVPDAPRIVSATSGALGGPVTASVAWTAPADGGSPITSYRIKATRWSLTGRKLQTATGVLEPDFLSVQLGMPRAGIWSFQVQAQNEVGWGPLSSRSKKVRGR